MALSTLRLGPIGIGPGIWSGSIPLAIGGFAVTDPQIHWVAELSYIAALALFFWGVTIHGQHLWQPWWRGRQFPLKFRALIAPYSWPSGAVHCGIKWEDGFTHTTLKISNSSVMPAEQVSILIAPDKPIIRSSVQSEFVEASIAPAAVLAPVYAISGQKVVAVPAKSTDDYIIGPPHRFFCASFPVRMTITVDLATVVPKWGVAGPAWHSEGEPPGYIDLQISYVEEGRSHVVEKRLRFERRN